MYERACYVVNIVTTIGVLDRVDYGAIYTTTFSTESVLSVLVVHLHHNGILRA